jgi:hypothetical protein
MRGVAATLALALALALALIAGGVTDAPFGIATDVLYTQGVGCTGASTYLVGVLAVDGGNLVIQDDRGVVTPLIWRGSYSARRGLLGGEVEVMDGRTVVATTGQRYKLGGAIAPEFGGRFWACGDVIPA